MASKGSLSSTDGTALSDPIVYRQLVGALHYLTMTCPKLQHVSQFVSSPTDVHHEAVKRILRYLKGTLGHGLPIRRSTDSSFLIAYSDANWQVARILSDTPPSTVSF